MEDLNFEQYKTVMIFATGGIWQGDPFSPFLFNMVLDVLIKMFF